MVIGVPKEILEEERRDFRVRRYEEFRKAWDDAAPVWQMLSDFLNSEYKMRNQSAASGTPQ